MKNTCLVMIAHGSKNPEWTAPFRELAANLQKEMGTDKVYLCFMENSEPSLMEVAEQIFASGIRHCRFLPMFMAKGNHFYEDIPANLKEVREKFPLLETELLEPIGLHPVFFEVMSKVVRNLVHA
jgi:sirohydrochlorin cobaltochelatase